MGKQEDCTYDASKGLINTSGFKTVPSKNQKALVSAINQQPVSVSIACESEVFKHYKEGILDSQECGIDTDHVVLAVGYGYDEASKQNYYIVRNSWGTAWGE